MKQVVRIGLTALVSAVALLALTAAMASAVTVTSTATSKWSPGNVKVSGTSTDSSLTATVNGQAAVIACTNADFTFTTPNPQSTTASITAPAGVTFGGTCTVTLGGMLVGSATVVTSGTWHATASPGTSVNIAIHTVQVRVTIMSISCEITITDKSVIGTLNEGNTSLTIAGQIIPFTTSDVPPASGSCAKLGIAAGNGTFTAIYTVTPNNLTITNV
jgi:hypothetical protein